MSFGCGDSGVEEVVEGAIVVAVDEIDVVSEMLLDELVGDEGDAADSLSTGFSTFPGFGDTVTGISSGFTDSRSNPLVKRPSVSGVVRIPSASRRARISASVSGAPFICGNGRPVAGSMKAV